MLVIVGITVLALALIVGGGAWAIISRNSSSSAGPPGATQSFEVASRNHVEGTVDYPQSPPVGGDHNPVWLNCGYYGQPVKNENAVHNLEHGAVWITYLPTLPAEQIDTLRQITVDQTFVNVSPYPGQDAPVVATGWGRQIRLQSATDPALDQFIVAFRLGGIAPEIGAPCTGGTGTPG